MTASTKAREVPSDKKKTKLPLPVPVCVQSLSISGEEAAHTSSREERCGRKRMRTTTPLCVPRQHKANTKSTKEESSRKKMVTARSTRDWTT